MLLVMKPTAVARTRGPIRIGWIGSVSSLQRSARSQINSA